MQNTVPAGLNLPPVSQVGFVVRDLDKALELYRPLFGDFQMMEPGEMEWEYRGRMETSCLKLAFGMSGDVEIELIEWVSGESPHKEFLDAGREGMHHLRFLIDNVEEKVKEAEALGYTQIWYKRLGGPRVASYLEREGDPLVLEFYNNGEL